MKNRLHAKVRKQLERYVLGDLTLLESARLEEHLRRCQPCHSKIEQLETLLEAAGDLRELRVDDHLCRSAKESLLAVIPEDPGRKHPRLIIGMKTGPAWNLRPSRAVGIPQIVAIAAAVIMVLLGVDLIRKRSCVAWGSLARRIDSMPTYKYHLSLNQKYHKMPGLHWKLPYQLELQWNVTVYHSAEYGTRKVENLSNFELIHHYPLVREADLMIYPEIEKHVRFLATEEKVRTLLDLNDPTKLLKQVISYDHTKLGSYVLEGRMVQGIEANDPRLGRDRFETVKAKLWADVETDLPVVYEIRGTVAGGAVETHMVFDRFEWDAGLGAEVFKPHPPEGSRLSAKATALPAGEATICPALRTFAEKNNGRYPRSLVWETVQEKLHALYRQGNASEPGSGPSLLFWEEADFDWPGYATLMVRLLGACTFYGELVREEREPVYYGLKVTSLDSQAPLLRWRIAPDEFRVIFGDLRAETLSRKQLEGLEKRVKGG